MISFSCNDTATTEIYTLSLHDALPISLGAQNAPLEKAEGFRSASCAYRAIGRYAPILRLISVRKPSLVSGEMSSSRLPRIICCHPLNISLLDTFGAS